MWLSIIKLKHAYIPQATDAKSTFNYLFIGKFRRQRVIELCKYSPDSTCHLLNCILAVLALFLANRAPISSS